MAKTKKTPYDPDGDGDVDVPSKLPPGMKNTGDTDKDTDKNSGPIKKVRDMVAAHSKVPDAKKAAYRGKCVAAARKAGAMQHIPAAWLKKGD